ncbi:MAG: hypothetical protein GC158_03960 [Cyanobacteria bacterium RI_101]|nr:hypothetical protein [Cyanobacteria bacterium RI_101]
MSNHQVVQKTLEVEEYYHRLHEKCSAIIKKSLTDDDQLASHSLNHSYIMDFGKWLQVLELRPEAVMLKGALCEYQYALLAVVQGQYRQAFMALRLFLELALGAVHFSANELELRIWLKNQRDIKWKSLVDQESGVFSKKFVKAFYEDLEEEASQYGIIAAKIYRECSEYVHGNAGTHHTLPETLEFIESKFIDWQKKATDSRLVVSFALCTRYLLELDQQKRDFLELAVLDTLGHISAIRSLFDKYGGGLKV